MKIADPGTLLKQLIQAKEIEHQTEGRLLKEHLHLTYENLKPANIIKNTFKEIISLPDLKTNLINAAIGAVTGYAAKKAFFGRSNNLFTKLIGAVLEMIVTSKVTENAEELKSIGGNILKKIIDMRHTVKKVV